VTAVSAAPHPAAIAPRYRPYSVVVRRTTRLSPTFIRVTLYVDDPAPLAACGNDQRVKLVLPAPGASARDLPRGEDWFAQVRALPGHVRPRLRTYTVRAARPYHAEIDLDVALHPGANGAQAGPGATWAATARPGDRALLVGPDRVGSGPAYGVEWTPPETAGVLLLAGDETAVPAVLAILESLPLAGPPAVALLEVPYPQDRLPATLPERARLVWCVRDGRPHGELLTAQLYAALDVLLDPPPVHGPPTPEADPSLDEELWDVPATAPAGNGLYAWLAGEAGMLRGWRQHLVHERGLPRGSYAVMGYWRRGIAGS